MTSTQKSQTLTATRGWVYGLCFAIASGLALTGAIDFDTATGLVTPHSFNLYEVIKSITGILPSGLAGLAVWKRWGAK